jgi:hypothetical protein
MVLIEKTQEVQAYDFIIFQEGNITKAFNTKTKSIEFQDTDGFQVLQQVINNAPNYGSILVKNDLTGSNGVDIKKSLILDFQDHTWHVRNGDALHIVSPDATTAIEVIVKNVKAISDNAPGIGVLLNGKGRVFLINCIGVTLSTETQYGMYLNGHNVNVDPSTIRSELYVINCKAYGSNIGDNFGGGNWHIAYYENCEDNFGALNPFSGAPGGAGLDNTDVYLFIVKNCKLTNIASDFGTMNGIFEGNVLLRGIQIDSSFPANLTPWPYGAFFVYNNQLQFIELNNANRTTIEFATIYNNSIRDSPTSGIIVMSPADVFIHNNSLVGVNKSNVPDTKFIYVDSYSRNLRIHNNVMHVTGITKPAFGIALSHNRGITPLYKGMIHNNTFPNEVDVTTTLLYMPSGYPVIVKDNINYNPRPPESITVGASPFVYQNTDPYPEDIIISGGNVSNIEWSRDGANWYSLGIMAGKIRLEIGEYLRVTYITAPTMTKVPT